MSRKVSNHIRNHKVPSEITSAFFLLVPPSWNVIHGKIRPDDGMVPISRMHDLEEGVYSKIWAIDLEQIEDAILKIDLHVSPKMRSKTEIIVGILCHTANTKTNKQFDWGGEPLMIEKLITLFHRSNVDVMLLLGCNTVPKFPIRSLLGKILISTLQDLDFNALYHFYVRFTSRMITNKNGLSKSLLERVRRSMDEAKNCQVFHGTVQING